MKLQQFYQDNNHAFQEAGYTCGPVTLLNVLRQKGDDSHTEEELAQICKAQPNEGTTNANLISGAQAVGLDVFDTQSNASLEDIERHLDQNHFVIVNYFYAFSAQGHYAQIADYDERALYLIDPTAGYMRIKKDYFVNHWHSHDRSIIGWFMAVR